MSEIPFKKISAVTAAEVCRDIQLEPAALERLTPAATPADFLQALTQQGLHAEAVKFLARALPKREAAWWACLCARHALDGSPLPALLKALEAAERWVYEPTEDHRRAAHAAAQETDFSHPASWAAMAAFWSGGSMAPPNVPAVPAADHLTGKATAGAVILAAVQTEPEKAQEKFLLFLRQGVDIACGGNGRA